MIVDMTLIHDSMMIPGSAGSLQMVDGVYPVIIGNVRGACQMLPDPDWEVEDQRGTRARTSVNNNNDDDNQGGCQSSRRYHGRKVCCWSSFDEGLGEEE